MATSLPGTFVLGKLRSSSSADPHKFFPKKDLMAIGAYYYPEQWPRKDWDEDLRNIHDLGFTFTHFAEFAWTFLEPADGKFDFKWLDDALDLAGRNGLKVILCTPTAAPPAWMGTKYPEIYLVDENGRRREHGNRANGSLTNKTLIRYTDRMVMELAKRYGHDKRVMGWQVDNEPLAIPDYSPSARKAFQDWLRRKYGTVEALNKAWFGSFWSTRYDDFGQVVIPNTHVYVEDKLSPHTVLDFKRFTADMQADYIDRQAKILHERIDPSQWVTTNYTNVTMDTDPRRSTALDFPTYTMYPVNGTAYPGPQGFRLGSPYKISEANDFYRPIRGVTGVMEMQPGQVNWASVNPQPAPGAVHMWLMHAFGGGCSFVCTYQYRHPIGSSEMYHEGIVGTDGFTLSRGGQEFKDAIGEMEFLRQNYEARAIMPDAMASRRTAFLWNHENLWDLEIQKQNSSWDTWSYRNKVHAAVKSTAAPVDFITEKDDFSSYPFLVAPSYSLVDSQLVSKWYDYVFHGGHLLLTCRSGAKDRDGHFFSGPPSAPISSLIGAKVIFSDMLPDGIKGAVLSGGKTFNWNSWSEVLQADPGTTILATYADQFYSGGSAAVSHALGKGTVTYIGVESTDGSLERMIIRSLYEKAGVTIEDLPEGLYHEWRDGFHVGVNYGSQEYRMPVGDSGRVLIGKNPLRPGDALVWKETEK